MSDPYKGLAEFQMAMLVGWTNAFRHTLTYWRHCVDVQRHFLEHATGQHRSHVEISEGPSFTDKYGRRAHDIDPERDV